MKDSKNLFSNDGQKEMKEFLLRIKNNLEALDSDDREQQKPRFAEAAKLKTGKVTIEFDEDLDLNSIINA